ncbi:hypothetical protein WJX81_003879 [Elliptochloris bilobata]|uniref:Glu-AdT subunit C n=1 Tax=Elliptochloris bilobata TaxID=381761 RepID=A0AAW1R390_9CHLO
MAQISVTDEEVREWGPKLEQIVDWFDQLQAVDVEGVPPATRADLTEENLLRPDMPRTFDNREDMMAEVPDREGPFVKVPKIS